MADQIETSEEKEAGFPWGATLWGLAGAALLVISLPAVAPTLGIGLVGSWACIAGAAISGFLSYSSYSANQEEKSQQEFRATQREQERSPSPAISQARSQQQGQTYEASYDTPNKQWTTDPKVQTQKPDIHEMAHKPPQDFSTKANNPTPATAPSI